MLLDSALLLCYSATLFFFAPTIVHGTCQSEVSGFAEDFLTDDRIQGASITEHFTGKHTTTDSNGKFKFCFSAGQTVTFLLEKTGYVSTYSGVYTLTSSGMTGKFNDVTFQVPTTAAYAIIQKSIMILRNAHESPNTCTVVTTVTAAGKTLADDPQGEPGATISLTLNGVPVILTGHRPYYFGISLKKTNIFTTDQSTTSADGGVLIYNLAVSTSFYSITAVKKDTVFSTKQFLCQNGAFLNLSPPQGPTVMSKTKK